MNKRFIVVVLDSFGVGAMADCKKVRSQDINANTALHLIERENLFLPTLQKLGIMNAIGKETPLMKFEKNANFAVSNLMHFGADTFFGHQEIMGTKPSAPTMQPFSLRIDDVEADLIQNGYRVKRFSIDNVEALTVNDAIFIGDNMETDLGQAINVSGTFVGCTFDDIKKVGNTTRRHFEVPRIIAFGGEDVPFSRILASAFRTDGFIGLDTPKSGVYEKGYMVVHIGFGVDKNIQLPKVLNDIGVKTYLYGKVADIVENDDGVSKFGVDTKTLLNYLSTDLDSVDNGFFCLNVQETDLAGHRCEAKTYADVLKVADEVLGEIYNKLRETDCMIVMADHGNDPYSGRSQHTRERVPLLIYNKNFVGQNFGERETMSDVGQTAANYFGAKLINGKSLF